MAMLDDIINTLVQPQYRPYFRKTYGFGNTAGSEQDVAPPDSAAPAFNGSMPQQAPAPFTDPMSGAPMTGPKDDPYAPANAAIDARRASTMAPGKPILGAGMLSDMGVLQQPGTAPLVPGGQAPALPPPVDVRAPDPVADAGLPLAAKPAMQPGPTAPPPAPPPAAAPGAGFLSRISDALAAHPSTLLAMGAGFAGAPSFGQGMSRAFGAAVPASKQDQAMQIQTSGMAATYKALVLAGADPHQALAAMSNPTMLAELIARHLSPQAKPEKIKDAWGNERTVFVNPYNQSVTQPSTGLPPNIANQPASIQRQLIPKVHPDGWTGIEQSTGRRVVTRGGQWTYAD